MPGGGSGGCAHETGRVWEGPGPSQKHAKCVLCVPWKPNGHIYNVFDGRPCSSWRYPDILVSPGEDPGRSWGRLGCLQELSGGSWGSVHEIGVSKGWS